MKPEKHKSSFLIYASNEELEKKVFELSRKYHVDLKNLVQAHADSKNDKVASVLIDLYGLTD